MFSLYKISFLTFAFVSLFFQGLKSQNLGFRTTQYDFGSIEENGPLHSFSFRFGWNGKEVLQNLSYTIPCSCLDVKIFGAPFSPGDSGWIKVMFDSKNRPGPFDFSVAISGENVASNLSIKGWVEAQELSQKELYPFESGSLRFKTNHLVFGEIFDGTNDTMSTLIYNQSNRVIKFSGPHSQIPAYVKFIPAAMLILPKTEISATLIIDPRMSKKWGPVKDSIVLVSNDIKEPKKNIFFSMNVKEKFPDTKSEKIPVCFIEVPNIELGKVLSTFKEQVRIHITNKGQEILRIRRVFSKCECIKFHSFPAALMPGESGDVVLKLDLTGRSGEFSKEIEIISSDPQNPIQKVSITASVKD